MMTRARAVVMMNEKRNAWFIPGHLRTSTANMRVEA
jgi:hypothetical protein